jgi:hypothetical protein
VSDLAGVVFANSTVKIVFAQQKLSGEMRSMIIIHMSTHAARQFVASVTDPVPPGVDIRVLSSAIESEALMDASVEPEQTVAFSANMVAIAVVGVDSCLDFYQTSTFAMANIATSSKVPIDPVVRVDLRTALLVSVIKRIQDLESSFPASV